MRSTRQQSAKWIPWLFVALFSVVVAANGVLVYLAVATWGGLQTENAYAKGLAFNAALAEARAREALGWTVVVEYGDRGPGQGVLSATLKDRHGNPLAGAALQGRLVRPTHAGYDHAIAFAYRGDGRYAAEIAPPLPGEWELRLSAAHRGRTYRLSRRIHVR
jgi:nitrogen fixation protein FixH